MGSFKDYRYNNREAIFGFNLETTITDNNNRWPNKTFNFKLSPQYRNLLKEIDVNYVSLANNHILDYGIDGMNDTRNVLDDMDIAYTGAGMSIREAMKPVQVGRFIFLSASDHYDYWKATSTRAGINYIDISDDDWGNYITTIRRVKRLYPDHIIVQSIHWGPNWLGPTPEHPMPLPNMQRLSYDLTREGVDIIHGHSPHHVLPVEMVNGGLVLYSCGDFIDDYKVSPEYDSNIGLLANILFRDSSITDVQLLATRVDSVMESNRYYHQVNMGNWKDLKTIEARTKM